MPAIHKKSATTSQASTVAQTLANSSPTPSSDVAPVVNQELKTSNVNNKKHSVSSLLVFIEGSSWTVDYYSQILGKDDELSEQQLGQSSIYQQYHAVKGMELKISGGLNHSEDSETRTVEVTGSSVIYPFVIPNVGDMFVAEVEKGRDGVFTITSTDRKNILRETCYEVEYKMVDYATDERLDDLTNKAVKTSHFRKDMLAYGKNPVMIESDLNAYESMLEEEKRLVNIYVSDFFSHEYKTLLVPDQDFTLYDHHVVELLHSILDMSHPLLSKITVLNCEDSGALSNPTLWKAITTLDKHLLLMATKQMWAIPVQAFNPLPVLNGINFSGIERCMYPESRDTGYNSAKGYIAATGSYLMGSSSFLVDDIADFAKIRAELGLPALDGDDVIIDDVSTDGTYVLSNNFYDGLTEEMSVLERHVWNMLCGEAIDAKEIVWLSRISKYWGGVERFYYIPLIILLIKYNKLKS